MIQLAEPLATELAATCFQAMETILERRSENDFEQLQAVLQDDDMDNTLQQNAIMLLGRWGRPEAVPAIISLLPTLDERGLINAVDALGRLGTPEAVSSILDQSHHPSPDVRRFAAYALDRAATPPALARLQEMASVDSEEFVRARVQGLLNQRGN
jgi:HEAT repeat protein